MEHKKTHLNGNSIRLEFKLLRIIRWKSEIFLGYCFDFSGLSLCIAFHKFQGMRRIHSGMSRESGVKCNEGTKATDLLRCWNNLWIDVWIKKRKKSKENKMHFRCMSFFQASMDLPPDKAKLLKNYDNEKKWDIICDQVSNGDGEKMRSRALQPFNPIWIPYQWNLY